jgi:hypothetical protein
MPMILKPRARLAMLFGLAFCFLTKTLMTNSNYFQRYVTSQPKRKNYPLKGAAKRTLESLFYRAIS